MLEEIKGIGPKTLSSLKALNIFSIDDLLSYYPYRYNVFSPSKIENSEEDKTILINGSIEPPIKVYFIKKNLNKLSFKLNTSNKIINVTIFNRAFMKPNLTIGKTISIIGKYNNKNNSFTASDIKLNPILSEKIEAVYHLNSNIKKANFTKIIDSLLLKNYYVKNNIPDYLMDKYKFMDKLSAIKEIHKPTDFEELKKSRLMLIYEELFTFMLKINYMKKFKTQTDEAYIKEFNNEIFNKFIDSLPFSLTNDQVNSIEDIKKDFNSKGRMNRLLLGDVGSGKTVIAFAALYMNYLSGYQGILMAPTEILADQHFINIKKLLGDKVRVELLTSSTSKNDRNRIIKNINNIDILIGTHSVLSEQIVMNNLGLVITDEQHRFGVNQRKTLSNKGHMVDVLYMSATPIPRTLALTLYGDMDISQIKTKPANRKSIITNVYASNQIKDVLLQMLDEIKKGHQIYVVAPLIEEDDNMESINTLYEKLNIAFNKKIPMAMLHGKLTNKEKNQIMEDFKENKIKVLISTTVIEVGVDVKNATMMVIFNAERFGLATLHQLRGRIGRNDFESKCVLISDLDVPRLKILEESNDGFYISEKDFELRGSGDLFGIKQSGDMTFKIANINRDYKILLKCKEDSEEFLNNNLNKLDNYINQKEIISSISFNE